MLDKRIEIKRKFDFFLCLDHDGEAILLALHRLFACCIVGLDGPIVRDTGRPVTTTLGVSTLRSSNTNEKYGLCEMRSLYPAAFAICDQANSTCLDFSPASM